MARASNPNGRTINSAQDIQVNKTVVQGRNQDVSDRMSQAPQITIAARSIYHNKTIVTHQRNNVIGQSLPVCGFIFGGRIIRILNEIKVMGNLEVARNVLGP